MYTGNEVILNTNTHHNTCTIHIHVANSDMVGYPSLSYCLDISPLYFFFSSATLLGVNLSQCVPTMITGEYGARAWNENIEPH